MIVVLVDLVARLWAAILYEAVFLVNFLGAENPHDDGDWRVPAAVAARRRLAAVERFFA